MKHAGPAALDRLERLLGQLRAKPALKEKSRGTFYLGGRAFLHFHEHGAVLYADIRLNEDFERFPVTTDAGRQSLLRAVEDRLRCR